MRRYAIGAFVISSFFVVACGANPVAPAPPPVPACERNHTGTLILWNKSANLLPRYFIVDGVDQGLVPWGQSISLEVAAGVAHDVVARNTAGIIITRGNIIVNQCGTNEVSNPASDEHRPL